MLVGGERFASQHLVADRADIASESISRFGRYLVCDKDILKGMYFSFILVDLFGHAIGSAKSPPLCFCAEIVNGSQPIA